MISPSQRNPLRFQLRLRCCCRGRHGYVTFKFEQCSQRPRQLRNERDPCHYLFGSSFKLQVQTMSEEAGAVCYVTVILLKNDMRTWKIKSLLAHLVLKNTICVICVFRLDALQNNKPGKKTLKGRIKI